MNNPTSPSVRRNDLDWLRVILILVIFIFHSSRFFDTLDWHVKNPQTFLAWKCGPPSSPAGSCR